MKVNFESTTHLAELALAETGDTGGILTRVWDGQTESGIKVRAFVCRIIAIDPADQPRFRRELMEERRQRESNGHAPESVAAILPRVTPPPPAATPEATT